MEKQNKFKNMTDEQIREWESKAEDRDLDKGIAMMKKLLEKEQAQKRERKNLKNNS